MKLVVTGAGGFIGSHAIRHALAHNIAAYGIELPGKVEAGLRRLSSIGASPVHLEGLNVLDVSSLRQYLHSIKPDVIVHAAGTTGKESAGPAWTDCIAGNLDSVASLIQALAFDSPQFSPVVILLGSQLEYGLARMPWLESSVCLPKDDYGASKLAATELLRAAIRGGVLRGCVCRLAVVYGPGQIANMLVPDVITHILRKQEIKIMNPGAKRQLIHVSDVVRLVFDIASQIREGCRLPDVLNLPATQPLTVENITRLIMSSAKVPSRLATPDLCHEATEASDTWMGDSVARALGFDDLLPLEDGMAQTYYWYEQNKWLWDI
jgi:nucleoside-diphosphate-sugar epimerase